MAILRLAKVVSKDMPLLCGWIDALAAGKPIRAFYDMTMAPAEISMVTTAISGLMRDRARGIFQLTGPRDLSYPEIGRYVAKTLGADPALVIEGNAADADLPAGSARAHTTLDLSRLRQLWNFCSRYSQHNRFRHHCSATTVATAEFNNRRIASSVLMAK